MPLLWSHAEFLKLLIAREQGRPLELLQCVEKRYRSSYARPSAWHWREELPTASIPRGLALSIEDQCPFSLHFGFDGWQRIEDRAARPQPFGIWSVNLTADELAHCRQVEFTRQFGNSWEGTDHAVRMDESSNEHNLDMPGIRKERGTQSVSLATLG
jgi:glucoamylase